jgi:hypothetical protein
MDADIEEIIDDTKTAIENIAVRSLIGGEEDEQD